MNKFGISVVFKMKPRNIPLPSRICLDGILSEFASNVPEVGRVELVVTSTYEKTVAEFEEMNPNKASIQPSGEYSAAKPDGAMAVAKTVPLEGGRAVVVIPAGFLGVGRTIVRDTLIHEAQHVRMIQQGDSAWAVHRRTGLELPEELIYEYVWLAETMIDEFRCERAMDEKGLRGLSALDVESYAGIVELFDVARVDYRRSGDLNAAYNATFQALDRLAIHLAYGAAILVGGTLMACEEYNVPAMTDFVDFAKDIPGSVDRISDEVLVSLVLVLAHKLREWLRDLGFDCFPTDGGGRYLEILDAP